MVLNRPVPTRRKHVANNEHLCGNERQELNAGTEPPVKFATNSMLATTHRLSTMRSVGNIGRNLAIHLRARAVKADRQRHEGLGLVKLPEHTHSLRHTLPNALRSVAVSSQSTQSWTQLPTKLSSLTLLTNSYNNASSAKSCNSLTQASYHRERVVDVSVNAQNTHHLPTNRIDGCPS